MELADILKSLEYVRGAFPKEAVFKAIERREDIIPEMLRILERDIIRAEMGDLDFAENYFGTIFSLYLLAQFREPRAYPLVVRLARLPQEVQDALVGDFITEALDRVLASVCGGDTGPIESLIEDPSVDEYSRAAGIDALKILVSVGVKARDEVVAYYKSLFNGRLERSFSFTWCQLVSAATRLHPEDVYEEIIAAYEDGLVEDFYMSLEDVEKVRNMSSEKVLKRLANATPGYIDDVVREMEWWHCFSPEKYMARAKDIANEYPVTAVRTSLTEKTGPNDPCTCGSGRKYKKCCGRIA